MDVNSFQRAQCQSTGVARSYFIVAGTPSSMPEAFHHEYQVPSAISFAAVEWTARRAGSRALARTSFGLCLHRGRRTIANRSIKKVPTAAGARSFRAGSLI